MKLYRYSSPGIFTVHDIIQIEKEIEKNNLSYALFAKSKENFINLFNEDPLKTLLLIVKGEKKGIKNLLAFLNNEYKTIITKKEKTKSLTDTLVEILKKNKKSNEIYLKIILYKKKEEV